MNGMKLKLTEPTNANSTLVLFIPHANDEDQTWRNTSFKCAEKEAKRIKAWEIFADSVEHNETSPEDDVNAEILSNWKFLANILGWEHPNEESHVEGLGNIIIKDARDRETNACEYNTYYL